jgi:hypothetical protein
MRRVERRKFQRVKLPHPIAGAIGKVRVFLINVARGGALIAHQDPAPPIGTKCTMKFDWDGRPVILHCSMVRTTLFRKPKTQYDKPLYHSAIIIESAETTAELTLREMISHFVALALDEQKANARGIPANAAQSFQTGKGTEFLRCDYITRGKWTKTKTAQPDQPREGFTVSVDEDPEEIERLCTAYETGDMAGRKLIRTLAAMSISKAEGVPTRRYVP